MRAFLTKKSVEQTIKPSRRNIWHFPSVTILFQKLALDFLCPFEPHVENELPNKQPTINHVDSNRVA